MENFQPAFPRARAEKHGVPEETDEAGGGAGGGEKTPAEERKIQKQRRIQLTSMAESRRAAEAFNNLTVTSFILQP